MIIQDVILPIYNGLPTSIFCLYPTNWEYSQNSVYNLYITVLNDSYNPLLSWDGYMSESIISWSMRARCWKHKIFLERVNTYRGWLVAYKGAFSQSQHGMSEMQELHILYKLTLSLRIGFFSLCLLTSLLKS